MIKIIKEGKPIKFTKTCPDCGCEFEYEECDVTTDYSICLTSMPPRYNRYIKCPWCGKSIHHGYTEPSTIPFTITDKLDVNWNVWPDCETCPNKPDPNKIVVGDTPCTWCPKNRPYCTTVANDTAVPYTTKEKK